MADGRNEYRKISNYECNTIPRKLQEKNLEIEKIKNTLQELRTRNPSGFHRVGMKQPSVIISTQTHVIETPEPDFIRSTGFFGKHENIRTKYEMSLNDWQKRAKIYRNRAVMEGLEDFADLHGYRGTFLTITCNKSGIMQSKKYVSTVWNNLQKEFKKLDITNFGMKSLEQQKSKIWHLHAIIFTHETVISEMETNVFPKYANHVGGDGKCIQRIAKGTAVNVARYITKAKAINNIKKQLSRFIVSSESRFFGIPKGIISEYGKLFKSQDTASSLDGMTKMERKSVNRQQFIKQHIKKGNMRIVLDALGAFKDIKKPIAWWFGISRKNINHNKIYNIVRFQKIEVIIRKVNNAINIIKRYRKNIRGPPSLFCHDFIIASIEKMEVKKMNTLHKYITGIPPPSRLDIFLAVPQVADLGQWMTCKRHLYLANHRKSAQSYGLRATGYGLR